MSPLPSLNRARIAFAHDTFMAALSFPLSMYLRLGDFYYFYIGEYILAASFAFAAISAPIFLYSRMYTGIWAYASIEDLAAITKGVTLSILIFLPALFLFTRLEQLPRSLPLIQWFILMALLGGPRFLYRVLKDRRLENIFKRSNHQRVPVMLIGAGDAAELFIRQHNRDRNAPYSVVAILDDKGGRVGRSIHGVPIVAGLEELSDTLASGRHGRMQKLILTHNDMDGAEQCYRSAVETDPKYAQAHTNLGYLLQFVRKDMDGAEECYRNAIEADPKYANAHNNLGYLLHFVRKDMDGAEECYRKGFEIDPT